MTPDDSESVVSALGILPRVRVWVGGHNLAGKRVAEPLVTDSTRPPTGPVDVALIAPESADEAAYFLDKIEARLEQNGVAWIILPPTAAAQDFSGHSVEVALGRYSQKLSHVPGGLVALPDGYVAHRFART